MLNGTNSFATAKKILLNQRAELLFEVTPEDLSSISGRIDCLVLDMVISLQSNLG